MRETRFWHQQGHQRAVANSGSIENIQKTTTAMNSVERQKTVNIGKTTLKRIISQTFP